MPPRRPTAAGGESPCWRRKGPLDRSAVEAYDDKRDPSILADLTQIRDDDQAQKTFSLDRESDIRIYALGEGTGGEMVDYGWIEDAASGRRVWEMTYRDDRARRRRHARIAGSMV